MIKLSKDPSDRNENNSLYWYNTYIYWQINSVNKMRLVLDRGEKGWCGLWYSLHLISENLAVNKPITGDNSDEVKSLVHEGFHAPLILTRLRQ